MKTWFLAPLLLASMMTHGVAATIGAKEILMLLRNGIPQSEIAGDIHQRGLAKALTPEEISALKAKGASDALLAAVTNPASAGSRNEAGSYKERVEERKRLEKLPKVWVYGFLSQTPRDAGATVACLGSNPSLIVSPETRAQGSVHFSIQPPTFAGSAAHQVVNCEAAVVGNHRIKTPDGRDLNIQEVVMLHDLGALAEAQPAVPSSPAQTVASSH